MRRIIVGVLVFVLTTAMGERTSEEAGGAPSFSVDAIYVIKSKRLLHLLYKGQIIKSYRISIGRSTKGHKLCEGDGRTPEGHYYIDGRNLNSHYYYALKISYPNAQDIAKASARGLSPGGNIMIHGLPPELAHLEHAHVGCMVTRGCIAVTNKEIKEIVALVADGTPVIIKA